MNWNGTYLRKILSPQKYDIENENLESQKFSWTQYLSSALEIIYCYETKNWEATALI